MFGVFKFLFGVIVNTSGETISTSYIGWQSPVPVAYTSLWHTKLDFFFRQAVELIDDVVDSRFKAAHGNRPFFRSETLICP